MNIKTILFIFTLLLANTIHLAFALECWTGSYSSEGLQQSQDYHTVQCPLELLKLGPLCVNINLYYDHQSFALSSCGNCDKLKEFIANKVVSDHNQTVHGDLTEEDAAQMIKTLRNMLKCEECQKDLCNADEHSDKFTTTTEAHDNGGIESSVPSMVVLFLVGVIVPMMLLAEVNPFSGV